MDSSISYNDSEHIDSHLPNSEMAYNDAVQKTELIVKDEDARRLRVEVMLLQHDKDGLQEQFILGEDRIDMLEEDGEELRVQLEHATEESRQQEAELRIQTRELQNLKAEVDSMNNVTMDSAKVLTEKLSLTRELSTLKPELEHLRSQVNHQQTILSEKLALQRQVSTLEVELETEKRAAKRAAKKNDNSEKVAYYESQMELLQKDLARENKESKRVQRQVGTLDSELETEKQESKRLQRQVGTLASELETEKQDTKRAAQKKDKSNKEAEYESQIEQLQKDLEREKKLSKRLHRQVSTLESDVDIEKQAAKRAAQKSDNSEKEEEHQLQLDSLQKDLTRQKRESSRKQKEMESEFQTQMEELREELRQEKQASSKATKENQKELKASESRHTLLESKVEALQAKLRAVKEQLKEAKEEVVQARAVVTKTSKSSVVGGLAAKKSRKRTAVDMSTDANIGTPDGVAARGKRPVTKTGRLDQTLVGEKSMFSITPFLNRTISMAPETPPKVAEPDVEQPEAETNDDEAIVTSQGNNTEEVSQAESPSQPTPVPKTKGRNKIVEMEIHPTKTVLQEVKPNVKRTKPVSKKIRPMSKLSQVAEEDIDENDQPVAPITESVTVMETIAEVKEVSKPSKPKVKKRKVLGATLFDEDDGEATKKPTKLSLGAPRLLKKGGLAGPGGGLRGGLAAAGGFGGFSPLKKDRRGAGASFLA